LRGYLERERLRNSDGQFTDIEYIIREKPKGDEPIFDEPISGEPISENPTLDEPTSAKNTQINIDKNNNGENKIKKKTKTEGSKDLSINRGEETDLPETDTIDGIDYIKQESKIKENIDYACLCQRYGQARADEIVENMLEMLCSASATIRVAGDDFPAAFVKNRISKLGFHNIEYVIQCFEKNTTKVKNIKNYLKTALFNSGSTIDAYYTAEANHALWGNDE